MAKFDNVKVKIVGKDGNAFAILGNVIRAMRKAKCSEEDIKEYQDKATSGDYDNLLRVTMETVDAY